MRIFMLSFSLILIFFLSFPTSLCHVTVGGWVVVSGCGGRNSRFGYNNEDRLLAMITQ